MKDLFGGIHKAFTILVLGISVLFGILGCAGAPASREPALQPDAVPEMPLPEIPLSESPISPPPAPLPLRLTFAGDIMAHRCNYEMTRYSSIYDDVSAILHADDITFGNLEMPVDDSLPLSTYPRFNVHASYVQAAVAGGFEALSLANNHSNDQGSGSMGATLKAVSSIPGLTSYSGLRGSPGAEFLPSITRIREQTVIFLAVTEILNSYDSSKNLVYYLAPRQSVRDSFLENLRTIRAAYPEALFVLSVHVNEPEYGRTVPKPKRDWFLRIAEAGVDIIWAHHPHVMQEWEIIELNARESLIMYSMGNFISGQRWETDPINPDGYREYTGDAILLQVTVAPRVSGAQEPDRPGFTYSATPQPVTNWRDPKQGMVVRRVTELFFTSLPAHEGAYYRERWRLMSAYLPFSIPPD